MAVAYFAAQKAYVAEKVGREMNVMEKLGYHQIITVAVQDPVYNYLASQRTHYQYQHQYLVVGITLKRLPMILEKKFSELLGILTPILLAEQFASELILISNFTTNLLIINHANVLRWFLDLELKQDLITPTRLDTLLHVNEIQDCELARTMTNRNAPFNIIFVFNAFILIIF